MLLHSKKTIIIKSYLILGQIFQKVMPDVYFIIYYILLLYKEQYYYKNINILNRNNKKINQIEFYKMLISCIFSMFEHLYKKLTDILL